MILPLKGIQIVSLATNVPGPVAAARLHDLGASIIKVEPPAGDPLAEYSLVRTLY
jgi:crotonobetainyl-CoA:carnitine CoA-transferase CaiB-like acyl-CoA transferase